MATSKPKELANYSIIRILRRFTKNELAEFETFLSSPYFNQNSYLISLFRELKKFSPAFESPAFTSQNIFKAVNKGKRYDHSQFRKDMLSLFGLAEKYLSVSGMFSAEFDSKFYLLSRYNEKSMPEIGRKTLAKIEQELNAKRHNVIDSYYYSSKLRMLEYEISMQEGNISDAVISEKRSLNDLIKLFILKSVNLNNQIRFGEKAYNIQEKMKLTEAFFSRFDLEKFLDDIYRKDLIDESMNGILFRLVYLDLMLNSPDPESSHYRELKEMIYNKELNIEDKVRAHYINRLIQYCSNQRLNGSRQFEKDLHYHFKFLHENDLFLIERSNLSLTMDFRTAIMTAASNGEIEWAEKFIAGLSKYLARELSIDAYNYGLAILRFYQGKFEESLKLLSGIEESSLLLKIDTYLLKSQIFYELGYFDSSLSTADTFRHHLDSSDEYSDELKDICHLFIRILRRLITARKKPDAKKLDKLRAFIEANNRAAKISWFRDKVKELGDSLPKRG
ncbi:MAG: hypothetical protein K1X85_04935 [Ignavibacteria bacterium]|nr:hypothetical protein [Ignavibacteria bacterium]